MQDAISGVFALLVLVSFFLTAFCFYVLYIEYLARKVLIAKIRLTLHEIRTTESLD